MGSEEFAKIRARAAASLPEHLEKVAAQPNSFTATINALVAAVCAEDVHTQERLARVLFPKAENLLPLEVAPLTMLSDWCTANSAVHRVLHESRTVTLKKTSPYSRPQKYVMDASLYACIPDGRIVPGWDHVLTPDGKVIADICYSFEERINAIKVRLHFPEFLYKSFALFYCGQKEERIEDDVFFLSVPFAIDTGYHFGHWMMEFLPRLLALDLIDGSEGWKIAVPENISAKQIESILLMGIPQERILKLRRTVRYNFKNVHVLKIGKAMPPSPPFVEFLRGRLYKGLSHPRRGKRVYLERGVGTREIANQAELEQFLAIHNFIRVDVAKMSLNEQRLFFADVSILLGSFGSALLATYFAPAGSVLIVLIGQHRKDPSMPHTCALIGVRHQLLYCEGAPPDPSMPWQETDPDLIVDCAELARRIDEIDRTWDDRNMATA